MNETESRIQSDNRMAALRHAVDLGCQFGWDSQQITTAAKEFISFLDHPVRVPMPGPEFSMQSQKLWEIKKLVDRAIGHSAYDNFVATPIRELIGSIQEVLNR